MDERLMAAAQAGDIDILYTLIRDSPFLLERIDDIPFVDTPLHVAASTGQANFAMEIMRLKPSFARKLNQDGFSPMHLALLNGQTLLVLQLLNIDGDLVRVKGREGITLLHYAAEKGNLNLLTGFLSVCPNSLEDETIRSENALHIALRNNMFEAFEVLLRWLQWVDHEEAHYWKQRILNWKDREGNTVLHLAISKNQPQVVKLLVNCRVDINAKNLEGLTALDILQVQNQSGNREVGEVLRRAGALGASSLPSVNAFTHSFRTDKRLTMAAQEGDVDALYKIIWEDVYLLDRIDQIPFANTPLHIAAAAGHTLFAIEIMRLKPSFSRKQNQDGFSPMHLALQNGQTQVVLRFLDVDRDLVRVKGREGMTPLHYAAEKGMVDLLAKFLVACPKSIQDSTIRKETALHIAAKNDHWEALEVLLGWLKYVDKDVILKDTDDEGNTLLHIATSKNHIQMVRLLLNRVDIHAMNLAGLTALDISKGLENAELSRMLGCAGALKASSLPKVTTLADSLRKKMSWTEKLVLYNLRARLFMSDENRNAILVVAVLIATATYQAMLSSPFPDSQDNNSPRTNTIFVNGTDTSTSQLIPPPISIEVVDLSDIIPQILFTFFNAIAFLASMLEIHRHLPHRTSVLQLVIPLVICYLLLTKGAPLRVTYVLFSIGLFFISSVIGNTIPIINYQRSMEVKHSILKHCRSFHNEMVASPSIPGDAILRMQRVKRAEPK